MRKLVLFIATLVVFIPLVAINASATNSVSISAIPHPPPCLTASALPNRLTVGGQARVAETFSTLRFTPATNDIMAVLRGGELVRVLSGPVCEGYDDLAWYEVEYMIPLTAHSLIGWVSEGQLQSIYSSSPQYWLEPYPATNLPVELSLAESCNPPLPPPLHLNGTAYVNESAVSHVSLRSTWLPERNFHIATILPNEPFEVLYGPICSTGSLTGTTWYQVQYVDREARTRIGYVRESRGNVYLIRP